MTAIRSSQINRVRGHTAQIFGPGFDQAWFATKFDRGSVEKLQTLLAPYMTPKGKKYAAIPPILFPAGSTRRGDVFRNPALIRVSNSLIRVHCMIY